MKKVSFNIYKWTVRSLMAVGALLGIAACSKHFTSPNPAEAVYGPPPGYYGISVQPIEDVYGPPVEELKPDTASHKVVETVQEQEIDNQSQH